MIFRSRCTFLPFLVLSYSLVPTIFKPVQAQERVAPVSIWNVGKQSGFVMSSLEDAQGHLWFGTEDKGIWRYDPQAPDGKEWINYTVKDGLGDDNGYALAQDHQGRIWVGHQSHGVSVFNGRQWRNYDVLEGPLGERVFDLAVSPLDGIIWIATNRGLSHYDPTKNIWLHDGRLTGLPSDQIQAIAFAQDGTLFVGTQCDGLVVGSPKDGYRKWQEHLGPGHMPLYAAGEGMPSSLINDILVGSDGSVYVATNYGLARSDNNGRSWSYLRGKDWKDKLKGLTFPPQIPAQPPVDVLTEDYVSALAEDVDGYIWLGHPTKGVEVRSPGAGASIGGAVVEIHDEKQDEKRIEQSIKERQQYLEEMEELQGRLPNGVPFAALPKEMRPKRPAPPRLSQQERTDYVTSILTLPGAAPLVCGAGSGVIQLGAELASSPLKRPAVTIPVAPLPLPATAPLAIELQEFQARVQGLGREWDQVDGAYLGEDWKTKGDWMGRYGMRYAMLCAMQAPFSQFAINDPSYRVVGRLGLHPYVQGKTYAEQGLRHWVHRIRWDDPRVLYNPLIGYRRQADIDDNGEVYPFSYEGPDMWVGARIPAGVHRVGLYFFNKDGHDSHNRVRDYLIDVKRGDESLLVSENYPTLARARVRDFWGGVYKSFLLRGPGDYYFVIRKNNSFNTVMQAVLIDKLTGPPTGYDTRRDVWLGGVKYEPPTAKANTAIEQAALAAANPDRKARLEAALSLWKALDGAYEREGIQNLDTVGRLLAYRAAQAAGGETVQGQALLQNWRWKLPLWPKEDRKEFTDTMKKGWDAYSKVHPKGARAPR